MTLASLLKTDFERLYGSCNFASAIKHYFFNGGHPIRWVVWFRAASYFKDSFKFLFPVAWLFMRHYEFKYGVHASTSTKFGPGLLVAHGDCVYLYADSVGSNCTFYQGVTLGRSGGGVPVVGDDVIVYTGATVIGNVELGDGCVIAAGAVVTTDVPAHSLFAGVPAKLVKNLSD